MTFASLPTAEHNAFDQWRQQVVKDCAWQQALPSLAAEFPAGDGQPYAAQARVDMRALLAVTGGGPLVQGEQGQLVLLDAPSQDAGVEHDARMDRHTIHGKTRVFDATADRADGVCVIKLDGEEIFRTELPSTVPVIASYDSQVVVPAGADLAPLRDGRADADPVAALDSRALIAPALAALVPTERAQSVLAARFATTEVAARQVFPLRLSRTPDVMRLRSVTGATPFAPGARIYAATASLTPIYAGSTVQTELLYDGLHADLIAIRVDVLVGAGGKRVQLGAVTAGDRVAHDAAASRACFAARGVASRFEPVQARSPRFDEQFTGCEHLAVDGYAALAGDADTRHAVAAMAIGPGVLPGAYRGWDQALIQVARRLDKQGIALTELDPGQTISALTAVLARHATLRDAVIDPAARKALGGALIELVLGWWFDGLEPAPALVALIGAALSNTVAYPASVQQMLADLGDSIDPVDAGPRAVQCGVELVGARRIQVDHALTAVAQVPFASGFHATLVDNVLQTCPTTAALAGLETSAAAVTTFVTADQPRDANTAAFQFAVEPLVDRALTQTWTSATFAALGDVVGFALVSDSTFCTAFASLAEQVACIDGSLDRFSAADPDGVLAPAVAARYATMARELTARWPALADLQLVGTRSNLTDAWGNGLWRGCSDAGFDHAKQQLFSLLDRLRAATGFEDRFALETQIADLLAAKTCT